MAESGPMEKTSGSCAACDTLARPLPCAAPPAGVSMWFVMPLLVLGVVLVIVGLYNILGPGPDDRRAPPPRPLNHFMGAPHQPAGVAALGTTPPFDETSESVSHVTDPAQVLPSEDGITFVFFHAPWCGHCKQFKPVFEKVAKELAQPGRKFTAVQSDILQQSPHADQIPIRGFPTILAFRSAAQIGSMVGAQGESALRKFIDEHAP